MKRMAQSPLAGPRRGAALIIVLGCLVILAAVLLAFLNSARTELVSSKVYADSSDIHSLVDTSINAVMAQIRQATTTTPTDLWASQPGLIRTFNNSGAPDASYKLYSSDTMQVAGAFNPATDANALSSPVPWNMEPAIYTDLNQPVAGVYPIVDPGALSVPVQGFSVTGAPATSTQSVPMPVKWLYVLQDGTLAAPTVGANGSTATVAAATSSNPIVGRIAFWTDDETCKINVNTASEGAYWDVPHFSNQIDVNLGIYQPFQNEFQSYPGHPAGVSLSTVFPGLTNAIQASAYNSIYAVAPRIQAGGSLNGTVACTTTATPVILDADRLYDSENEVMFSNSTNSASPPARVTNATLAQTDIQRASFFVTAHSRAPELTPFGTPKVSCWPINTDLAGNPSSSYASAFDKLIATCSTLNGNAYYFQRQKAEDPTYDYASITRNQTLYGYLSTLMNTKIPGFGGNLATKFGTDSNQILTEIFDYIRCTDLNDLNVGTSYQYATGTLTQQLGQNEVVPITIGSTRGFGRFVTITEGALWLICTADPTVNTSAPSYDPTKPVDSTKPVSNVPANRTLPSTGTLTTSAGPPATKQIRIEAAFIMDPFTPMHGAAPMHPDVEILVSGLENWTIQGDSDTSATNFQFPPQSQQTYSGAGVFQLGPPASFISSGLNMGGNMGTAWGLLKRMIRTRNNGLLPVDTAFATGHLGAPSTVLNEQYPFVSEPVTVNVKQSGSTLNFSGGPVTITVRQRSSGTVIQTLTMNFPQTALPAPILSTTPANASLFPSVADNWTFQAGGCGVPDPVYGTPTTGRLLYQEYSTGAIYGGGPYVDTSADVIYAMVAANGGQTLDPRFVAMTGTDTTGVLFQKDPYYDGTHSFANDLIPLTISGPTWNPSSQNGNSGTLAQLPTGKLYTARFWPAPQVPYPAAAAMANGDWDNGVGYAPDGGYLNEPDPGNISSASTGAYDTPYFNVGSTIVATFTSPSRMIPSPGMFGSLPTTFARSQVNGFVGSANSGWQTLLFRRQPTHPDYTDSGSSTPKGNGGFSNAPDYLLMDLFWMPIVEPYAISETLSTAGKINMNYQIVPFTYIQRNTGLYAALTHEKVISVPTADYTGATIYKQSKNSVSTYPSSNYRLPIQIPQTLTQFDQRFNNSDGTGLYAFRTPSEICDIHLIPNDPNYTGAFDTSSKSNLDASMAAYWASHTLTGDNCRERPYTTLYERLTTRSNTFRVHYRVQTLKQALPPNAPAAAWQSWREGTDLVTSEGRGSVVIERYLDNNDTSIADYAANATATPTLESHYQFRTVSMNRFAP